MKTIIQKSGIVLGIALGLLLLTFASLRCYECDRNVVAAAPTSEIVDIRLDFVDLTYYGTETGTLTIDIQAQAWLTEPIHVRAFQDGFWLDETFYDQFITATFSNQFFPAPSYVTAEDTHWLSTTTTGSHIWFALIYGGGASVISNTNWFTVVRTTIVFSQAQAFGNVSWTDPTWPPIFTVFTTDLNEISDEELPIPSELQHIPLSPNIAETRLEFVDLTYHGAETGTLTLDMQARVWATETIHVQHFQNAFLMDPAFYDTFITSTFTNHFFSSSDYHYAEDPRMISFTTPNSYNVSSGVWFALQYARIGTASAISTSDWITAVRITTHFTQAPVFGNITWTTLPPNLGIWDQHNYHFTGNERPMPAGLQNIPLSAFMERIYLPLVLK